MTNNWQPIETAPKDGTDILILSKPNNVWNVPKIWVGRGDGEDFYFYTNNGHDDDEIIEPEFWMPLPELPKRKSAQIIKIEKEGK